MPADESGFDRCKRHDRYVGPQGCPDCAVEGVERIGDTIGRQLPAGSGAILVLFSDSGLTCYWSNTDRDSVAARLKELAEAIRRPLVVMPGRGN